jgi:hypothetical protein
MGQITTLKEGLMFRKVAKVLLPVVVLAAIALATLCMACCTPAITTPELIIG